MMLYVCSILYLLVCPAACLVSHTHHLATDSAGHARYPTTNTWGLAESRIVTRTICAASKRGGGGGGVLPRGNIKKQLQYYGVDADKAESLIQLASNSVVEWATVTSNFLSPAEANAVEQSFKDIVDVDVEFTGGYASAVRKVAAFKRHEEALEWKEEGEEDEDSSPSWELQGQDMDTVFALVNIEGNFLLDKATDTDFLASILALPHVGEEAVGDILVTGERGAQIITTSRVAEDVINGLKQVRTVPVSLARIDLADLKARAPVVKELMCVESSTRLDAIGSAGLGISRSRMVKVVEAGDVTVNFRQVKSAAAALKTGDVVMVKAVGKLDVVEISETRKGKVRARVVKTA
jgi:RNA-binding protein YlmH